MNILNKEKIENIINELKSNNLAIYTNIYFNDWWLDKELNNISYEYKEKQYLNIYIDNGDFVKLYFAICDFKNYNINTNKTVSVDYYNIDENDLFIKYMLNNDFLKHSEYHKWIVNSKNLIENNIILDEKFNLIENIDLSSKNAFTLLNNNFDKLSDDNICDNLIKMNLYSYGIEYNDKLIALLIYDVNENDFQEKYICVDKEYNKLGLATYLLNLFTKNKHYRFNAWINDNNIPSIKLHEKFNFKKTKTNKITFIKE